MAVLRLNVQRARKVLVSRAVTALDLRMVLAFKEPRDAERVIGDDFEQTLGDGNTPREEARRTLETLIAEEVLVPVGDAADMDGACARFGSEASTLAQVVEALAGDLGAMGAFAQREVRIDGEDPLAVLSSVRSKLDALRKGLGDARARFVAEQMQGVVRTAEGELFVHLGSGTARVPGWTNVDLTGGDVRLNLCWELPFADASVRYLYSAHTLEHFDFHTAARRLVKEIHRVLAPGGTARIVVPDIGAFVRQYAAENKAFFREYDRTRPEFAGPAGYRTDLAKVMRMAGSAVKSGWFFEHKMGYDFDTLADILRRAGFSTIERSEYRGSRHEALRGMDDHSASTGFSYEDVANSLFVEATKEVST
ncbi:class I SAM-dependent methyltransferase [Polyangium jinanense]|uniref:Methyltransferase domain-containing protein n=1 Tax=Polyangium jinanense TaxID=2829994 RepID=A0A9X3XE81_9BACT|nr:methyltransferase domain-containing protein [Polyangium jinanense]MDC3957722.1 methyltransferase domain-containing protein [Polyangium jinanense]MDC3987765.1 methyltransferase domain-containing protein [Polyangium jinanense]